MKIRSFVHATATFALVGCATSPGDGVDCPVCDNATALLVGAKCVPIGEVEACGPDGHLHGAQCHCFSGQEPTTIGGVDYCLQAGCSGAAPVDLDAAACNLLTGAPEAISAVPAFADFESAHVGLGVLAEVTLPANQASYVHFPGSKTGLVHVYLDEIGVLVGAVNASQQGLTATLVGANEECENALPEAWEIAVVNESGTAQPQVLEFAAGTVATVRLVLEAE